VGAPGGERKGENEVLRSYLRGDLATIDAADAAALPVSAFLDLVDRVRSADATFAADQPSGDEIPDLSVVVPMFNEEGNLTALLERLVPALESIGTYEIVFVDDLSTDRSREIVLEARTTNPAVKLVELARNFGHQGALAAGLAHAVGRAVVLMDADLQDPPEVLPDLAQRWKEGYEVVYAIREKRKEGLVLRACFYVFYRLIQRISEIDLPLDAGDFCLMDRKVVDALLALPESNRYLRGLRGWVGFRQIGVPYERGARLSGETKYSIRDRVRFAVDGLLSFSDIPLRLASLGGILTTVAAVAYLLWAILSKLLGGEVAEGWTSIIFIQLIIGGIQLIMIGVSGEYLARTYQETKRRPSYVLRATHGARRVDELRR
jgi:polyisoprenyl-phosphate glycosyltransferase